MSHSDHETQGRPPSLNRLAARATTHCLTGCAIGEVLGLVIRTALGWTTVPTIALAVALAFVFGYSFTLVPLMGAGSHGCAPRFAALLGSLAVALTIAWVIAFPVNRWLIARGHGHAVVHGKH